MKKYMGFTNYETYKCQEEFFSNIGLDAWYDPTNDLYELFHGDKDAMAADVAATMVDVVEDSLAFSADYRTNSDVYIWAMRAIERVDFTQLAWLMMDDWF